MKTATSIQSRALGPAALLLGAGSALAQLSPLSETLIPATVTPVSVGPIAPEFLPPEPVGGGRGGGPDTPSVGGDYELAWLTIDGGGIMYATGGAPSSLYELGSTAGQPDPGIMSGDCYQWIGGFWVVVASPISCYPNCDESLVQPILNVADFTCFLQKFAAGSCYANCDQSTQTPILNVADFTCFLQKFAAGCP